jgi:serine protease Do
VHLSWGLRVSQVTPFRRQQYRLSEGEGLVVVEVESGSPAEEAGIEEGDVLLDWEQQSVRELQQLRRLERAQPGNEALLLRLRKGQYRYYALLQPRGGQRQR